jgi:hypothetical protein
MAATVKLSTPVMIIALAILVGFAYVFYNMYILAETEKAQLWERRMALYGTIEALAFTAAGYLFGKEVHREQAAKAEQRAEVRAAEAAEAKRAAAEARTKGQDLKEFIETKRHSTAKGGEYGGVGAGDQGIHRGHLLEIAELAKRLFP